jgi:hypothetical protein
VDIASAEKAIKNGATAGFISAALTVTIVAVAYLTKPTGDLRLWGDPLNLLDGALIAGLAYGIGRHSRTAAVSLLLYFIASKIVVSAELKRPVGMGVGLVFLFYYWRAVQGTFAYHRARRVVEPSYRASSRWAYVVWTPVLLLGSLLATVSVLSALRVIPSTGVLAGSELKSSEVESLMTNSLIDTSDEVVLFYSGGLISILEQGSILTNERLITYYRIDEEIFSEAVEYSDIQDVAIEEHGTAMSDSVLRLVTRDGSVYRALVSGEGEGDSRFVQEIRSRIQPE